MDENCGICGEELKNEFSSKLYKCDHVFHYKCLLLSFKNGIRGKNECPYCRSTGNKLPLVNGIKKIDPYIHDMSNIDTFETHTCNMILKRGKNKGSKCSKNCVLGYDFCRTHLKKDIKDNNINNM